MKRQYRITRAIDFKRVRQSGKKFTHPLVVIVIAKGVDGQKRVGIVTNKTIGNAITRNLIKRRLRAITGQLIQNVNKDVDILLFAREPIRDAPYQAIWQAIEDVFLKAELILEKCDTRRSTSTYC